MTIGSRNKKKKGPAFTPKVITNEVVIVEVNVEPIELYKILKIENLVEGGGEAKVRIANGEVMLNGLIETRKRKKVYNDDEVEYLGQIMKVKVI
ncbi:MAG: RNA-binding S4 domain-containing protein [Gammaproteobacteria bacterium]|nr:RNA-binding S4 domain-containing protein [Gammaproteobacteria bacterium]